jgi:hypothetical protein
VDSGQWFSIEVLDGATSAALWSEIFRDSLVADALSHSAQDWTWHRHAFGVVFEVAFADEEAWERFRSSLTVLRALDAAPDPISGVIVYKGRGGSAGRSQPRRPRPLLGSGAAALPLPIAEAGFALFEAPTPRLLSS